MMSCSSSGLDRICAAHPQSPTTYARCVELVHSRMINEQFVPWWTQKLFGEGDAGIRLIKGNIPSKSRYSSVKYAPLLDADFKISPKCCNIMKKAPLKDYFKETKRRPITGMMAEESLLRKSSWIQRGCNAFGGNDPKSNPMSFWTDQDVFKYVVENNVKLADVYGEVVEDGDYGQIAMLKYDNQRLKCTGVNRSGWILTAA